MCVILSLQFRKGYFKVPNETYFASALIHETPEAFKYGHLSKINTEQASREWNSEILFHSKMSSKI